MRSLDCETDGLDLRHGARPFFVTICNEDYNLKYWEWSVDPLTRIPLIPEKDKQEIRDEINNEPEGFVLQNGKFDCAALFSIGIFNESCQWNWATTYDTLLAGHLLASNQPHDLTTMTLVELGINIKGYEEALRDAVNEARRMARSKYPDWKIAKRGLEGMPSAKEAVWHYDMWLPRAFAKHENYAEDHPWWTVLQEYSNADSSVTLPLLKKQLEKIEARGLTKIYQERRKLLPIVYEMESQGITANKDRTYELKELYTSSAERYQRTCVILSDGKLEELPVNGASNALRDVVFNHFGLIASKKTPKGEPSLDKYVLDEWSENLPKNSKAGLFVKTLRNYRKRKTALSYIDSYESYWLPALEDKDGPWKRLYPSLNCTGTTTLRWSSQNPNETQISKQEIEEVDEDGKASKRSARYMFGPLPGEEWWSCDAQNIERRIPVYEVGEESIIALFEKPNEPPYYGSEHALVGHILYPKEFEKCGDGKKFKEEYKATLYQWTKNCNFALQYQCQEAKADETAHLVGAYKLIKSRFKKLDTLNKHWVDFANKYGYVETIPDKSVDPDRGYPLWIERSKWGKVSPTTPLSYHIQSTAMQWMNRAMVRVSEFLKALNRDSILFRKLVGRVKTSAEERIGYRMVIQQHDELVFAFPQGLGKEKWRTNRPIIAEIQRIMSLGGQDIGVPTPCSASYHSHSWGEEIVV